MAEVNLGDAYSTASGSFVAPVNGYYVFNLFMQTWDDADSDLALTVNDSIVCTVDAAADFQHSSCSAAVQLTAGDTVNVKAAHGDAILFVGDVGRTVGLTGFLYLAL